MGPERARPGRRVVIVGGSISGLIAGNLFRRSGWDVDVYERAVGVLEGRGAGITILPGLVDGLRAAGVEESEESLGVELPGRIALDRSGRIVAELDFSQWMTSWRRLFEALRAVFPDERYHPGRTLERVEQRADRATACFAHGERVDADLLIGSDGLRSTLRSQLLPELEPHYGGYIAWRCLTDERDLSEATQATLLDRYSMCIAPGEQAVGYPVPGPDHSRQPGRRQYNVVWYHPVSEIEELPRMLTDDTGRCHAGGIPPSLVSRGIREEMHDVAEDVLAPQFAEAIRRAKLVFFQPMVDLEPPCLAFGRIALIGDAGFVTRPHVAMGVPKAAGDALALLAAIERSGGDVRSGLAAFELERLPVDAAIVARGRQLGAYMEAQLGPEEGRRRAEQARDAETVLMETAAPTDYDRLVDAET